MSARVPVSRAQESVLRHHWMVPTSCAYHTGAAFVLHHGVDDARLNAAVALLARRHDMLRSVYLAGDIPERLITDETRVPLVRGRPVAQDREALLDAARFAICSPMDLAENAFRIVVRGCGPDDLVVVVGHHASTDAAANAVLIRELLAAYRTGTAPAGPPGPSYLDAMGEDVGEPDILLPGGELLDLGAPATVTPDRARRRVFSRRGATVSRALAADETTRVTELARTLEVTPFALLFACLARTFQCSGRVGPGWIGVPMSTRRPRFAGVIGPFVRLVPMTWDEPSAGEITPAARAVAQKARAAVGALAPVSRPPRVTFNLIGSRNVPEGLSALLSAQAERVEIAGLPLTALNVPQMEGQVDLAVHLQLSRGGLLVELRYDTDLFVRSTIERLAADFVAVITDVADPGRQRPGPGVSSPAYLRRGKRES